MPGKTYYEKKRCWYCDTEFLRSVDHRQGTPAYCSRACRNKAHYQWKVSPEGSLHLAAKRLNRAGAAAGQLAFDIDHGLG